MPTKFNNFPNIGFLQHSFDSEDLIPILDEVNRIKHNFESCEKANDKLVGNIKKEFEIIESKSYLENLLIPFITEFDRHFDYMKNIDVLTSNLPFSLDNVWVNFQEKFEFNPNHNHSGFMSFVLWIDVPFDIEDEKKSSPGKNSIDNLSGNFQFQYINSLGLINSYSIPVDKSYKNTMIMFPSKFIHCVYPFYSSDDFRISIAGNFYLKS
jgi:hypothetical protein